MELVLSEVVQKSVGSSLANALASCLAGGEVVSAFDVTFQAPYPHRRRLLRQLQSLCDRDSVNQRHVRLLVKKIGDQDGQLPHAKQRSADATLAQLAQLLPKEEQHVIAIAFLLHERRSKRISGYKWARNLPDANVTDAMFKSFVKYRDPECLRALALADADLREIPDLRIAIASLADRYYQARVIQAVLVRDRNAAKDLAEEFPMAYIWAAGRQWEKGATDFVIERFVAVLREVEASTELNRELLEQLPELRNLVWALGRVGATKELNELGGRYEIDLYWAE